MQYVGSPYVYEAAGPNAFDCSGFVQYVYAQMGISLPRTSGAQAATGTMVSEPMVSKLLSKMPTVYKISCS